MSENTLFILLVEDDPDISAIATMALHLDDSLSVISMRTAQEALDHLSVSPKPDLILTDNNLPDLEGIALAAKIRAAMMDPPPIAFFTASVRASDRQRFEEAGAIGLIAKPFDPSSLASQVRSILKEPPLTRQVSAGR